MPGLSYDRVISLRFYLMRLPHKGTRTGKQDDGKHKVAKERQQKKGYNTNTVEVEPSRPWPDLPHHLLKLITKRLNLLQCLSFGGVCKMWQAAPRKCNSTAGHHPRLQVLEASDNESSRSRRGHVLSVPWCDAYWKNVPQWDWKYCVGSSHGWLVMRGAHSSSRYYLVNPFESSYMVLPPWDPSLSFGNTVLSSAPPICTVLVLTAGSVPGFAFFRFGEKGKAWTKENVTLTDPNSVGESRCPMQLTNVVAFQGKFYALSMQGTLVLIDIDSHPRARVLRVKRAVPSSTNNSRCFREYLVESSGDILLIFLVSRRPLTEVDEVEVFRLDHSRLSWMKMDSLGDRVLFLGVNCCMSISASKLGCREDRIYFTNRTNHHNWLVFDMTDGSIMQEQDHKINPIDVSNFVDSPTPV